MTRSKEQELYPEDELARLFEPRRPDPAAFREGVNRRIEERRRAADERREAERRAPLRSALLRRAAALLPIDPGLGATGGALAGAKWFPAALALPALVLASAFGAFAAGARALARTSGSALPDVSPAKATWRPVRPVNSDMALGGRLIGFVQFGSLLAFAAAFLFGGHLAVDVLVGVLLVSMAALVVNVRGFASAGMLSRESVARLGVGLLAMIFTGCFLWFQSFRVADDTSSLGVGWSAGTVWLGVFACLFAARRSMKGAGLMAVLMLFVALLNPFGLTFSWPSSVKRQLAELEPVASDLSRWREAAALFTALESVGAELPDLGPMVREVARTVDHDRDAHPVVWTAAAEMGLIDDEQWGVLACRKMEAYALDQLLADHGAINRTTYYSYRIPMLLATRELSADQHEALVQKVDQAWPEPGDHAALDVARMCVALFDELGRPDRIEARSADAHALLRTYWVSGAGAPLFAKVGGFTSNPEKFETSFDDCTWHALQLMARVGVPEEIDLHLLRSLLRRESHAMFPLAEPAAYLDAHSRASLLYLERGLGLPPRTWFELLLAERLLIASLLIVGLCLVAIRLAPPGDPDRAGALP
jgi:hypothetical protein